jgi:rubrerythrin
MDFRVKEISSVLKVTPAAVTQYLKGRRGNKLAQIRNHEQIINALAEKAAHKIRHGTGPLEIVELLDAGYQLLSATKGQRILEHGVERIKEREQTALLRERLQLELKAAQKCLDLANRTRDDYSKLLLRMIASDSIRHADIVSQLMSWLESGHQPEYEPPARELLNEMLAIEDKASESTLRKSVRIPHAVAMLLLESIDMDEEKHDRVVGKMLKIITQNQKVSGSRKPQES